MPWKGAVTVSDIRLTFVHQVLSLGAPLAQTCREHGVCRETGYKWLKRFRARGTEGLTDQSRRPHYSPGQTRTGIEWAILQTYDRYHWGAAKIHAYLTQNKHLTLPSVRTVHAVLKRNQRVRQAPPQDLPGQRFERQQANQLWQMDFKAAVEIRRQHIHPLTILDDHSRYLLKLTGCQDTQYSSAWAVLWDLMQQVGMPEAILSDNYFGNRGRIGISWFESRLIRLGIAALHGRIYHPQTQGKVERLHGTLQRELFPYIDTSTLAGFNQELERWRTDVYNTVRPHEALQMQPPITRWKPSPRERPDTLPPVEYPSGSILRKVHPAGCISYRNCRIVVGMGISGQYVRVEEFNHFVRIFYCWKQVRILSGDRLKVNLVV
jgi:transposase InsO family protein